MTHPDTRPPVAHSGQPVADPHEQALVIAYRYLNRRERTQAEVHAQLARAGIDPPDADRAIATLVEQGYLDDARFVRLFVQDKRELEEWGSDRIKQVLMARGADPDLIEQALTEQDSTREIERAVALLRRRFPAPVADRRERERALGVLLRKGYELDLALYALTAHSRDADEL